MIVRLLLCLLILPSWGNAQSSYDSLQKIWLNEKQVDSVRFNAIAYQYDLNNSDLVTNLKLTNYHFELARKKKSELQQFKALRQRTEIQFLQGDLEGAKISLKQTRATAKEIDDPIHLFKTYLLEAAILVDERKFVEAIKSYNIGNKICKDNGLERGEITTLSNLATIYTLIRSYDLSLQYLDEAERRSNEIDYTENYGLICLNKGNANNKKGDYIESIYHLKKGLKFFIEENNEYHQSSCYYLLASNYHEMNDDETAMGYLTKSLKIDSVINHELRTLESLTLLGSITLKEDPYEAERIGLYVLSKMDSITPLDIQNGVFALLHKCYKRLGKYKKSLEMHELFTTSNDSMLMEEANFAALREVVKYEYEIELQEKELTNERERAKLEISQIKKNYLIISISVLIIVLTIIFFLSKNAKMRRKREELLKELHELKSTKQSSLVVDSQASTLHRERIQTSIDRKLNETDWKVLQILFDDPMITNKEIAGKAFLSEDGIGSSLRRMYDYFDVKETKYKKIALLMNAIKRGKE